ncbi:uncharacterized protein EV154DRAFT_482164 [Mucor mucedo]|uniref:uncharacterized protein n=1 Tax=Mucor mucedo TaxID=29922 RepID=UPI00221F33CD|nr:uncharacterized protein EV154DRAFT_482164 [Mucor mucedo]KAI7890440.1 hypothetical protein EV154DRAFT_482164 [Mucor mucedo]
MKITSLKIQLLSSENVRFNENCSLFLNDWVKNLQTTRNRLTFSVQQQRVSLPTVVLLSSGSNEIATAGVGADFGAALGFSGIRLCPIGLKKPYILNVQCTIFLNTCSISNEDGCFLICNSMANLKGNKMAFFFIMFGFLMATIAHGSIEFTALKNLQECLCMNNGVAVKACFSLTEACDIIAVFGGRFGKKRSFSSLQFLNDDICLYCLRSVTYALKNKELVFIHLTFLMATSSQDFAGIRL